MQYSNQLRTRRRDANSEIFYVVGVPKDITPGLERVVIVMYKATQKGWNQRCVRGRYYSLNNEYVSKETRQEIEEWRLTDYKKKNFMLETLEAALECRKNYFLRKR